MKEQELLVQVKEMSEQCEKEIQEKALDFNIFKIAGIMEKEVIMCRVLYELLCPSGTHGMGNVGMKLFLEEVLRLRDIDVDELCTARVFREYVIPGSARRIDLVIETSLRFLPIEVKIYAEDQDGQCYDYYRFAKERMAQKAGNKFWKLYYLTLDGHLPSEKSTKNDKNCSCLIEPVVWGTHIRQWLEHLTGQTKNQNVKEALKQYMAAIRFLSNQNEEGFQMKLNQLLRQPGNMKSAQMIANGLKLAKTEFMRELYRDIKDETDKFYAERYIEVYPLQEQIAKYYNERNFPGLTYQIHTFTLENKHGEHREYILAMHFQIEWRSEMGFIIIQKSAGQEGKPFDYTRQQSINIDAIDAALSFLKAEGIKKRVQDGWWLDWFYVPTYRREPEDVVPDFFHCNDAYYQLYEELDRKAFIRSVVNGFKELYSQTDWKKANISS